MTKRYYERTPEMMTEICRNQSPDPKKAKKSVHLLVEAKEIDGCTAVCRSITPLEV